MHTHCIDPARHATHTHRQPMLSALPVLAAAMQATQKSIMDYVKSKDPTLHPLCTHDHEGMPVAPDIVASSVVYMLLDSLDLALLAFERTTQHDERWPRDHDDMPY